MANWSQARNAASLRTSMAATKSTPARHAADDLRVAAVAAPVRAQVLSKLRDAILKAPFAPGERLIERELCELTGSVARRSARP